MLTPAPRDLTFRRNSDYKEIMVFKGDGVAVDVTGGTFKMVLRKGPQSDSPIALTLNTVTDEGAEGIRIVDGVNGKIELYCPSATLAAMSGNPIHTSDAYNDIIYDYYYYDLRLSAGSENMVMIEGVIHLYDGATY